MSSTSSLTDGFPLADFTVATGSGPIVAEVDGVRLRLHLRRLRGPMSLVEVSRRCGLNRDELSRLERGETTQVRFSTLARLLSTYDCSLSDLIEVERPPSDAPLYTEALEALADGVLPAAEPGRRAVRRESHHDEVTASDDAAFGATPQVAGRRRSPVGTFNT